MADVRIVKVQVSLYNGGRFVLVYDERREWEYQFNNSKKVRKMLGNSKKSFWMAQLKRDGVELIAKAPWQDW